MNFRRLLISCLAVFLIYSVTTAQENIAVCYNGSTTISFIDDSTTDQYQWQVKSINSQDWNVIKNWSFDKFVDLSNLTTSIQVRYLTDIDNDQLAEDTTDIATITVYPDIVAATIGAAQTICYNTAPTPINIQTQASGGNGSFSNQWQSLNGGNWTDIAGETRNIYQPGSLTATTQYRLKSTSDYGCGTVYSNEVTITVYPNIVAAIIGSAQTICYNTAPNLISIQTQASGGNGSFSNQWQSLNGGNWTDIAGETGNNYQPGSLTATTQYRLKSTSDYGCGTVYSNEVTITVYPNIVAATIGSEQTICYNTTPTPISIQTPASGGNGSFSNQWQSFIGGNWTDIAGETGNNYQPGSLTATTQYRLKSTSDYGCGTVYSNEVTITVYPNIVAATIGSAQTICYNTAPNLISIQTQASGGNGSFSNQWQSLNGGNWTDIAGETGNNYQPGSLTATTQYRLKSTSDYGCGTVYSNEVTITVYPNIVAATIGSEQTICYNTTPTPISIQTPASGGNGSFSNQWQSFIGGNWTDIAGETGNNYQPGSLTATTQYRLKSTSDYGCGTVYSNEVTITVYDEIDAGQISETQTICYNTAPGLFTFSKNPSGAGNTYNYQWFVSDDALNFTPIISATNNTYQAGNLVTTKYYKVAVTSTICGTSDESNTITITVLQPFVAGTIAGVDTICAYTQPHQLIMSTDGSGGNNPYTYQWQQSTDKVNFVNINGATNTVYQPLILTETTYYRLQFTSSSGCGIVYSNSIEIYVYPLPAQKDLVGDLTVCRNVKDVHYSLSTAQENIDYQWFISGGEIISNPNMDNIIVNWDDIAGIGLLTLLQTDTINGCSLETVYTITKTENFALNKTQILKKNNSNFLICSEKQPECHYEWGFTNLATQMEQLIPNSDYPYVEVPHAIDTTKYDYFVNTTLYYNGQTGCTTRTYWLKDVIYNGHQNQQPVKLNAFPNPAKEYLSISIERDIEDSFVLSLKNAFGQTVLTKQYSSYIANETLYLNLNLPIGIYLLILETDEKVLTNKIIIE